MAVKKLSIKTKKDSSGKTKLVIHKNKNKPDKEAADPAEEVQAETSEAKASIQLSAAENLTQQIADHMGVEPDEGMLSVVKEFISENSKASMKISDETGHETIGTVQAKKNNYTEPDIDYQELIAVMKSNVPMANVGFGMDRTINLGNYENVKIHIVIHVPSIPDEDEIEGNYEFAKGWVEQKMEETVKHYVDD